MWSSTGPWAKHVSIVHDFASALLDTAPVPSTVYHTDAMHIGCVSESQAPGQVACAAGAAGNQAAVPKAAAQLAGSSTGGPALIPPPLMPRRTALKQPAGTATSKPPPPPPAAVAGAPTAATGMATAAAAGSKASSQDKRQQNAKAYLARLQEGLPAAAYQQLMKHLQRYRRDHDTLQVTDGVLDVLRLPSRRHLLLDFAAFLRTQDRDWFLRCVK